MTDRPTLEKQKKLLGMLAFFHGFCAENGLTYYALGGTLLGAARHRGFIPWDDDVDVGMPRSEYDRLRAIVSAQDTGKYVFEFPDSPDPRFCYPFGKMYDTGTTLIENLHPRLVRGVYIDIFPLDGLCDGKDGIKKAYRPVGRMKTMLDLKRIKFRKNRSLKKNLALAAARLTPPYINGAKRIALKIDGACRKKPFESCRIVGNLVGAWGEREFVPAEFFGKPVLLDFEDIKICCPADYDGYLTSLYRDWRTPPPPEKQITHHDCITDLDTPYAGKDGK
ncbi:MAG: LicD family protein [Clostridia bacterium]|nr:LicD family protein [Clostridia bacterium]